MDSHKNAPMAPAGRMRPKAILHGVLATMALDVIGNLVLGFVLSAPSMDGAASSDVLLAKSRAIGQSTEFLLAGLALGTLSSAVGGFLTARRAIGSPLLNALVVGVVCLGIGIALIGRLHTPLRSIPYWYLYAIPGALAGAWLFVLAARNGALTKLLPRLLNARGSPAGPD